MIMTAEEFLKPYQNDLVLGRIVLHKAMVEFAQYHVKLALEAASKNAFVEYTDLTDGEKFDYTDVITDDDVSADVNKESIINAYPLDKIK